MEKVAGKLVATKEESGDVDLSESETGSEEDVTGRPVAYKTATEKPCASSKSDCLGGPKAERVEWSHDLHVSPATIHHHGRSILDRQGDLRTRTWRPYGWYGACGTVIPWNWNTDQWTTGNHWCKQCRFQRCYVDVDKLSVWKCLSDYQRQNLRLLRLCGLRGKNGRWSCCDWKN